MYQHGWYQIAFAEDLKEGLTPLYFAQRRLMAVKQNGSIRVFEATCPHRGAHLAYGGQLDGAEVICPFHGLRIHLGACAGTALSVRDYPCLVQGNMIFIRLSNMEEPHLPLALEALQQTHTFISGFAMSADVAVEIAAENALDNLHFKSVHGILNEPVFTVYTGPYGELRAEGDFVLPPGWTSRPVHVKYTTAAFSPGILISELCGSPPYNYIIISTVTPAPEPGTCIIRLSLALKPPFEEQFANALLEASRAGLEKDREIWTRVAVNHIPQWTPRDTGSMEFARFCSRFRS